MSGFRSPVLCVAAALDREWARTEYVGFHYSSAQMARIAVEALEQSGWLITGEEPREVSGEDTPRSPTTGSAPEGDSFCVCEHPEISHDNSAPGFRDHGCDAPGCHCPEFVPLSREAG